MLLQRNLSKRLRLCLGPLSSAPLAGVLLLVACSASHSDTPSREDFLAQSSQAQAEQALALKQLHPAIENTDLTPKTTHKEQKLLKAYGFLCLTRTDWTNATQAQVIQGCTQAAQYMTHKNASLKAWLSLPLPAQLAWSQALVLRSQSQAALDDLVDYKNPLTAQTLLSEPLIRELVLVYNQCLDENSRQLSHSKTKISLANLIYHCNQATSLAIFNAISSQNKASADQSQNN